MRDVVTYDPAFYDAIRPGVQRSAKAMWPDIVNTYCVIMDRSPRSALDVGCGEGWWALTGVEGGHVERATGIDGPWGGGAIDPELAHVDYMVMDISDIRETPSPVDPLGNRYDLAICLEVAEHVDRPDNLIAWLTTCADVVVFSGAIPGQPGNHHINCRWQHEWAAMFEGVENWMTADAIRPLVWCNQDIEWWYRQNVFVAYRSQPWHVGTQGREVLSCVHPDFWEVR